MREYITADTLANAMRMTRPLFAGAFLLVEGASDAAVYGRVVDHEACQIKVAHDRDRVLGAIAILNKDGFLGVVGIIDADFDRITGHVPGVANVCQTDLHDVECMMLNSPAFDRVLEEFGGADRISAFSAKETPLIARRLAANAAPLGCLRLISLIDDLNLKFEGLAFQAFADRRTTAIDVVKMIREVVNKSRHHEVDQEALRRRVEKELARNHDCWQISCGHDIVGLLAVAVRRIFSGKSGGDASAERLEQALRLAYEAEYLRDSQLARRIREWEEVHSEFKVLLDA